MKRIKREFRPGFVICRETTCTSLVDASKKLVSVSRQYHATTAAAKWPAKTSKSSVFNQMVENLVVKQCSMNTN